MKRLTMPWGKWKGQPIEGRQCLLPGVPPKERGARVMERRYASVLYRVRYLWPHVRRTEATVWLLGTQWMLRQG